MGKTMRRRQAGFSIIEALIAVVLVSIVALGLVASVIISRQLAEYDKQRLAAISAARRELEIRSRRDLFPTLNPIADVTLDNFNTPDEADDLRASMTLEVYSVNADGSRGAQLTSSPTTDELLEVVVRVSWNRTGSRSSARVSEELHTYVAPDL